MLYYQKHIFLCINQKAAGKQCCATYGGEYFFDYLKNKLMLLDMYGVGKIRISKSGCLGRCLQGPGLVIYPEGLWYKYQTTDDLDLIINNHLVAGITVPTLLMQD